MLYCSLTTYSQTTPSTGPTILLVLAILGYIFCYYQFRLLTAVAMSLHFPSTQFLLSQEKLKVFSNWVGYYALYTIYHLHVVSVRRDVGIIDSMVSQAFPSSSFWYCEYSITGQCKDLETRLGITKSMSYIITLAPPWSFICHPFGI